MGVIQLEKFGVKGLNVGSSFKMDAATTHTTFDIEHAAIFSSPFLTMVLHGEQTIKVIIVPIWS